MKKCPYCDFNSHQQQGDNDTAYMQAVLADLDNQLQENLVQGREIQTIFIGGWLILDVLILVVFSTFVYWLIKVSWNGCFDINPVLCPRTVVLSLVQLY